MCDFEVWPGPMEGVGRQEFVQAASALKLTECWMTPFIRLTSNIPTLGKMVKGIRSYLDSTLPVTVQLMGCDPDLLGQCGNMLMEKFPAVCGINLNCGCPSGRVVRHRAGGGMLMAPEKLADFCSQIAAYLPKGALSVKLRSGFSDADDMEIFLPALADSGAVSKIFFHYRTVAEFYSPSALPFREERVSKAVKLCGKIPLIANGDITSVNEAKQLVAQSGCAGVMIARPWMRDPFLLRRFQEEVPDAEIGRERFFAALIESGVGGGALIETAKMLWGVESARFKEIISKEKSRK